MIKEIKFYEVGRGFAGLRGVLRGRDGARNFPRHAGWGGNGARKIHAGWGQRSHPSAPHCPIAIPKLVADWYHVMLWCLVFGGHVILWCVSYWIALHIIQYECTTMMQINIIFTLIEALLKFDAHWLSPKRKYVKTFSPLFLCACVKNTQYSKKKKRKKC